MNTAIIIPAYNEKENVQLVIPAIYDVVPDASVIFVDDHSPDGTAREVKKLCKKFPRLHLIERKRKGGRGSAVMEGMKYAHDTLISDVYIEMDADLSHDPAELRTLISLSKPKTIVLASRYIQGGKVIGVPKKRMIMSWWSNLLIYLLLRLPITDNTNGYRCYRKDAVEILLRHPFISHGYILLSEAAYLLYVNGFSFVEFPSLFIYRKYGFSKTSVSEVLHALRSLVRIRMRVRSV